MQYTDTFSAGGSKEYPQSMFWNKIGILLYTPVLVYKSGV